MDRSSLSRNAAASAPITLTRSPAVTTLSSNATQACRKDGSGRLTGRSPRIPSGGAMTKRLEVPARQGRAIFVERGQALRVINTHGHQVVDFWAFHSTNSTNYLSMKHCRVASGHVNPRVGDTLVDNRRDPMLKFESDDSPGLHDSLLPACDRFRYIQLGVKGFHDSCADNLQRALAALNRAAPETPQ